MQAAQRVQHQQEEKNKKETKPDLKDDPRSIVVCISGLQESQIGQYTDFVKKNLELTRKMKDIWQEEESPFDLEETSTELLRLQLAVMHELHAIFLCFRRIYEFIIHLHKQAYWVKPNANTLDHKDLQLQNLLETTFCKYKNMWNMQLTMFIQFGFASQ